MAQVAEYNFGGVQVIMNDAHCWKTPEEKALCLGRVEKALYDHFVQELGEDPGITVTVTLERKDPE